MGAQVRCKRIYDDASPEDGRRILVDRIWPRGVRKDDAHLDQWMRDLAPSTELRQWFGHDPERYVEFRRRYLTELRSGESLSLLHQLSETAGSGRTTLLTAARDLEHSQAAVLADWLNDHKTA